MYKCVGFTAGVCELEHQFNINRNVWFFNYTYTYIYKCSLRCRYTFAMCVFVASLFQFGLERMYKDVGHDFICLRFLFV